MEKLYMNLRAMKVLKYTVGVSKLQQLIQELNLMNVRRKWQYNISNDSDKLNWFISEQMSHENHFQ